MRIKSEARIRMTTEVVNVHSWMICFLKSPVDQNQTSHWVCPSISLDFCLYGQENALPLL